MIEEIKEVERLLAPGKRRRLEAVTKLRSLAILDRALSAEPGAPSPSELVKMGNDLRDGRPWESLFPGVAAIDFSYDGSGPSLAVRIVKKEGIPVNLVPEGTSGASVVAVRRVNELDFYSLGHRQLAERVGLTQPKLTAVIRFSDLNLDAEYAKEITIGNSRFWRYSAKAIDAVGKILSSKPIEEIWESHRPRRSKQN